MRRIPVSALLVLLLILPIPAVAHDATPATASPVATTGDFAGLVGIGGRSLYRECRGEGSPTVILEAGAGNDADIWDAVALPPDSGETAVLPGVAAFTRVCAYDRPGTILDRDRRSRSDLVPMPRDASDMVADLHALLTEATIPGPYVLVGHSFGGLVVRLYAATYPDEVAGLVLVDAVHEVYYDGLHAVLTPAQWATAKQPPAELADDPDIERIDPDASAATMREAATALRPLPVVVLSRVLPFDLPPDLPVEAIEEEWTAGQNELAALAPGDRHVMATESGHYVQLDQPQLVIAAIRDVVEAVRDPMSWTAAVASPTP